MGKIKVLDKKVAELIAAGEVVERPSSVIKELVENAVDAGASVITVEIRNGGIRYMRITDNGSGIPREDVPTAFLRHATSKITAENDLESIATLGFRGEALASIAAMSRVEMLTRTAAETAGTRYVINDDETFLEEAGCPVGTTIMVRDLFYNTPARMKFLKKDITEGNAVAGIIDKIALSHPEISFRFIRDGKKQLHTPGDSKLLSAVYAVYGKQFADTLIPVEYELGGIGVKGLVSLPTQSRGSRSMQSFFINGRFIKSRTAMAALEEAYKGSIMAGKFPACVLRLQLSFEAVDVNVHPAKLEVRFVNERPIFDAVYHAVKSALAAGDRKKEMQFTKPMPMPDAPLEKHENLMFQTEKPKEQISLYPPRAKPKPAARPAPETAGRGVLKDTNGRQSEPYFPAFQAASQIESVLDSEVRSEYHKEDKLCKQAPVYEEPPPTADISAPPKPAASDFYTKLVGEAFDTYIILQYGSDALMLIDKHAAHERILYEKLKAEYRAGVSQTLLEPVMVTLSKEEYSAVLMNLDALQSAGFQTEDFGAGTVMVRSAPLLLEGGDVAAAVMEIAGYLTSFKTDLTTEHLDWIYHNVACRVAIKGGNRSTDAELIALAKQLEENPDIRYCPHGRPVSMLIKKKDLEKQFGRVQ